MKQESIEKLRQAVPYFRSAMNMARKKGIVKLAVLWVEPDGTKGIQMECVADELFNDIALAIDLPEQTEQDDMRSRAIAFLQKFNLGPKP